MGWISMKDKKPMEGQKVIYYFSICGINIGKYNHIKATEDDPEDYDCFMGTAGFLCNDVTHWMPLPEPPKEEVIEDI